ncbi:MAG: hypothetical protein V4450_10710 [Bacteroidota bacterium]
MRLIERLQEYLVFNRISAYAFEHDCQLANGYLGKQLKGKGSVGSDILLRIKERYTELSLVWLVTGKGNMLLTTHQTMHSAVDAVCELTEEQKIFFSSKDDLICLLNKQIEKLGAMLADKEKIIYLQEKKHKENVRRRVVTKNAG